MDPQLGKEIRLCLEQDSIEKAESLLDGVPDKERTAEWNYLKGCVFTHKGWFFDAQAYFKSACQHDPENTEYQEVLRALDASVKECSDYSNKKDSHETLSENCDTPKSDFKKNSCFDTHCPSCCEGGCECCCEGSCTLCCEIADGC